MEDLSGPTQKKRRVTKACDRCRQKRQRCETGPSPDGACAVCIASGTTELCTFTRQSKRRGPQRGVAQSLGEKVNALERLMGHLLLVDSRSILAQSANFFNTSIPPLATPEGYLKAFRATSLPQLLEELSPSPPVEQVGEVTASDDKMSVGEPSGWGDSPVASTSRHSPSISSAQSRLPSFYSQVPHTAQLPHANSPSYGAESRSSGLQTLATAAFANYSTPERLEGLDDLTRNSPKPISLSAYPPLPPEMIRHQLVDLYFSQIVHPTYPMLDKFRFFRWSAHLPLPGQTLGSQSFPPELYYAVFAITIPYLNPAAARSIATAEVYAAASRAALFESLARPSLETVQAACILALYDWSIGALDRAWILSSLAIALGIRLALHLKITQVDQSLSIETDPESYKVKTFFSSVIIHTLISLRLHRAPMVALEDYNIPLPPSDGPENYELWRTDPPDELRAMYDPLAHNSPRPTYSPRIHAVRSCALSALSQTAKLSLIAIGIIRYRVNLDSDHHINSPREAERQDLANRLASWERELPGELRLSEELRGIDGMASRSRHVVELHLLLCTLYQHLAPPPELLNIAFNPEPEASQYQSMILGQFLNLFTFYRCLPTIELSLNSLAIILFQSNGNSAHHDDVFRAFLELGNIFPTASSSYAALQVKSRPKHALPQPTPLQIQANHPRPDDPLRGYSDFSGDPQSVSQYLDFGVWDQNDLLIPLGLVVDSGLTWTVPALESGDTPEIKPNLLLDDVLFSGMPGSPMGIVSGMRTPMNILTPPQGAITPTGNGNGNGGMSGNGLGGAYGTDLFARWLDKGMLDFSGQQL